MGGIYDNHPILVFFGGTYWYIFNQDLTPIPLGAAFNVYVPDTVGGDGWLVQTATSANISGNATCINSSDLNENPAAQMVVTPNWNPSLAPTGVYDNHPIGVYYNGISWCIFNQDRAAMPTGAAFNVLYRLYRTDIGGQVVQTATSANSSGNYMCIDNTSLNNLPNIYVWVTPNWNPGGVGRVYDNHNIGVFSINALGRWCIFNQDWSAMPIGAAFNVFYWTA